MKQEQKTQKATFAAGCFWGVEALFQKTPGVILTMVGYTGGNTKNPTYEEVCSHGTSHAEAVQIEYDPKETSYEKLLDVFWENHNPTTTNQQGPDIGSQYRSAIFFHNQKQEKLARASREILEKSRKWKNPIVTEIIPAQEFYKAEEYHQKYLEKRGATSCRI